MQSVKNVYRAANALGEAAIWHAAQRRLMWIDLMAPRLFVHDPITGQTEIRAINLAAPLGAITATSDPERLILSHRTGISVLEITTGATRNFASPEKLRDEVIYNDCKVDRWGRLWAGTSHASEREPRGALWCVLPDGTSYLGDAGFAVSNGPAFSLDGRSMYFNDSVGRKTFIYDISADDPYPRNRRVLINYTEEEGMPDGLTVDEEDCLWVAHWGGFRVTRFSRDGKQLQSADVPCPHVTTVGFGGMDYDTLYVTTARDGLSAELLGKWPESGDLFSLRPGVRGVAEPLFLLAKDA